MNKKDLLAKYKQVVYIYEHRDEGKKEKFDDLLNDLNLTEEQVSSVIEKCKGDGHCRATTKASILLRDFFANASEEDREKFSIFALLLLLSADDSRWRIY